MAAALNGVIFNELHFVGNNTTGGIDANGDASIDNNDNAIELLNTSGSPVDLTGWEIWLVSNNAASAEIYATLDAFNLSAGGYYTVVESTDSFTNLDNVGDGEEADTDLGPNSQSTFALYDPGSNQYILLSGPSAGASDNTIIDAIVAAHPGAAQVGATDTYGFFNVINQSSMQREIDGSDTWEQADATLGEANCFAEGTLIATPGGETAVDALKIGDPVLCADGRAVPVRWVGRQTVVTGFAAERARLVRIAAGTLGTHRELRVTQDHGMILDSLVINAGALVGLPGIDLVPLSETPERFAVFHIETEAHDVILANGAAAETFIDCAGRRAFDNYAEYLELYGAERIIADMDRPRISAARMLPEAIRARLGIVGADVEADAALSA